jgi:hypothetical protein
LAGGPLGRGTLPGRRRGAVRRAAPVSGCAPVYAPERLAEAATRASCHVEAFDEVCAVLTQRSGRAACGIAESGEALAAWLAAHGSPILSAEADGAGFDGAAGREALSHLARLGAEGSLVTLPADAAEPDGAADPALFVDLLDVGDAAPAGYAEGPYRVRARRCWMGRASQFWPRTGSSGRQPGCWLVTSAHPPRPNDGRTRVLVLDEGGQSWR